MLYVFLIVSYHFIEHIKSSFNLLLVVLSPTETQFNPTRYLLMYLQVFSVNNWQISHLS